MLVHLYFKFLHYLKVHECHSVRDTLNTLLMLICQSQQGGHNSKTLFNYLDGAGNVTESILFSKGLVDTFIIPSCF